MRRLKGSGTDLLSHFPGRLAATYRKNCGTNRKGGKSRNELPRTLELYDRTGDELTRR